MGKIIFNSQVALSDTQGTYTLDLPESTQAGIYMITVKDTTHSITSKVVVNK